MNPIDPIASIRSQAALFDVRTLAVIATTTDGTIVYWNAGAQALYGWTESEVVGTNVVDVTPTEQTREHADAIMRALLAGRTWSGNFRVRDQKQQEFTVSVRDVPVHDEQGNLIGVIGVSHRVTESAP